MLKELERMGYISRRTDNGDKRAKEIRLTARGLDLISQSIEVINEVCAHYASKAGAETLNSLEQQLRDVVGHLELDYLPPAWTEQPLTPTDTSKKP
jgi:DNA-binding MarR family transcriptional regulator